MPARNSKRLLVAIASLVAVLLIGGIIVSALSSDGGDGVYKSSVEADFVSNSIQGSAKQLSDYAEENNFKSLSIAAGYTKQAITKEGIDGQPLEVKRSIKDVGKLTVTKVVFKLCKKSNDKACLYVLVASQRDKGSASDNKITDIVAFSDKTSALKVLK